MAEFLLRWARYTGFALVMLAGVGAAVWAIDTGIDALLPHPWDDVVKLLIYAGLFGLMFAVFEWRERRRREAKSHG